MAAEAPQKAIKMLGQFELISKIGQGGMGSVFKAKQVTMDRLVAVKILPPSIAKNKVFVERFIREARTSAKLNHPNIVQGIEVGQDETTQLYYFAMEYVDGPTVRIVLKQDKFIEERRALEIVSGVAQALVCAQRAGIVHRDIKPDNILLTSKGEVKLADLGLARGNFDNTPEEATPELKNRSSTSSVDLTQIGVTLGTPNYMAPEQIRGEVDKLDVRTDLYALGATWFHMATGRVPFVAPNSHAIMELHLTAPVPDPREVNEGINEDVAEVIVKLLKKDPAERFQSAQELVDALDAMERGQYEHYKEKLARKTKSAKPVDTETSSTLIGALPLKGRRSSILGTVVALVILVVGVVVATQVFFKHSEVKEVKPPPLAEHHEATPPITPPPATVAEADKRDDVTKSKAGKTADDSPPAANIVKDVAEVKAPKDAKDPAPLKNEPATVKAPAPAPVPEPEKKVPPPKVVSLDEEAAAAYKEALTKFDLPAAHKALSDFEDARKLEPLQRTGLDLGLQTAIETRSIEIVTEAKQLVARGEAGKAIELLNTAKFSSGDAGDGEIVAKASITTLIDSVGRDKFFKEMFATIKKWEELDNILAGVGSALEKGHLDVADKWLDAAMDQNVNAHLKDDLNREKEMLGWYAELDAAVEKGCEALGTSNPALTLVYNDARTLPIGEGTKIKAVKAKDGVFFVEAHDQKGMSFLKPIKLSDLTSETRLQIALATCEQGNAEAAGTMKAKWAYVGLSSFPALSDPHNAGRLDALEKIFQEARGSGAKEDVLSSVLPWLVRVQARVRNPKGMGKNHVTPYLAFVRAHSAGNKVNITINTLPVLDGGVERHGLNVVAIDNGNLLMKETFDTALDAQSTRLHDMLVRLPRGTLVVAAGCDEATATLAPKALSALKLIGAKSTAQPKHSAYICVGLMGLEEGYAFEQFGTAPLEYPAAVPAK